MGASFRRLADNLGRLSQVPSRAVTLAVPRINALIATQYALGQDPYGKGWQKLAPSTIRRKYGDTRILIRTNLMASRTIAVARRGSGIELRTEGYGGFHQSGTKYMPARSIFPDRPDLPGTWKRAIREAIAQAYAGARK